MLRAVSVVLPDSPKEENSPSARSLLLPSGRRREARRDAAACVASLSFLSDGLEMYYYANVNFDTEFKKRSLSLLSLFCFFPKKSPTCSHRCFFILYHELIVTMHSAKGGEERTEGEKKWLCILVLQFLCPWCPMSWRGRGARCWQVSTVKWERPRRESSLGHRQA